MHIVLPGCRNLKQKRRVIRPLVQRMRDKFGVSAAEVGLHDVWHSSIIAMAAIGTTPSQLTSLIDDAMNFARRSVDGVVAEMGIEVLSVGELHPVDSGATARVVDAGAIEDSWLEEDA
jgi:hypothetical protein